MRILFLAIIVLLLSGCAMSPEERQKFMRENPPQLVGEQDGVKLWHALVPLKYGGTQDVFFTTPGGATNWREKQGKVWVEKGVPGTP
jgi:hypothetical protein